MLLQRYCSTECQMLSDEQITDYFLIMQLLFSLYCHTLLTLTRPLGSLLHDMAAKSHDISTYWLADLSYTCLPSLPPLQTLASFTQETLLIWTHGAEHSQGEQTVSVLLFLTSSIPPTPHIGTVDGYCHGTDAMQAVFNNYLLIAARWLPSALVLFNLIALFHTADHHARKQNQCVGVKG